MNVYDFDGTIYDGESSVEFIRAYLKHDLGILKFIPGIAKAMLKYQKGAITFDDFMKNYAAKITYFFAKNNVDLMPLVKDFWDRHEKQIKPFYAHVHREDDVIITASPEFMMYDICERIGVKHLIATDFDIKTGEVKKACFREGKIPCFREAFPDGVIDDFYTDSVNDEFLFPFAKRVFMVKKHKITQIK